VVADEDDTPASDVVPRFERDAVLTHFGYEKEGTTPQVAEFQVVPFKLLKFFLNGQPDGTIKGEELFSRILLDDYVISHVKSQPQLSSAARFLKDLIKRIDFAFSLVDFLADFLDLASCQLVLQCLGILSQAEFAAQFNDSGAISLRLRPKISSFDQHVQHHVHNAVRSNHGFHSKSPTKYLLNIGIFVGF